MARVPESGRASWLNRLSIAASEPRQRQPSGGNQFSIMLGYSCGHGDSGPPREGLGMTTRKRRPDLLEVWLELFEKIEGPRRRREAEFRRRRQAERIGLDLE